MDNIGLDDLSDPELIFHQIDWQQDVVEVGQVHKNYNFPQVKEKSKERKIM